MKIKNIVRVLTLCLLSVFSVFSCNYSPQETTDSIKKGNTTIAADESLRPIMDAQMRAYQAHYPEATFDVTYLPEQKAINLLISDSVQVIAVTRELEGKELTFFEQNRLKYEPAPMALDAVVLIINKGSDLQSVTINDLKQIFTNKNSAKQLVFDNSNSSNLGYMRKKLGVDNLENANIVAANGNADVFNFISRNRNAIGVVGFNWLSDDDDRQADSLRQSIRILKVAKTASDIPYLPTTQTLMSRKYPLERLIYLHTTQSSWGVAKGFIRFSCSQIGQLVVEKMGLIPYYIIPKKYVIDNTPVKDMLKPNKKVKE